MSLRTLKRIFVSLLLISTLTGCAAASLSPTATPTPAVATATPAPTLTPIPIPTFTPTVTPTPTSSPSATPSPTPTATTTPVNIQHVVIISIDGLRPDALEQADTPILDSLRAKGAYSAAAQAVLPSVTLIAHASMLSGMTPAKHGITWNDYEPERGKINGPTLFSVAHAAGLTTAMVVGKPKFEHLVLPNSVDNYVYAGFTDQQVTDKALAIIQASLPNILFIHLPNVDTAGHALGWMSAGQLEVIHLTDGLIGEIVGALETGGYTENTLLIITADHGGVDKQHGGNSPEEMTIPWLAVGPGVPAGVTLQSKIVTYDTAATALHALNVPQPARWDGRPVLEIFSEPVKPAVGEK
jgi:hypothetical protein